MINSGERGFGLPKFSHTERQRRWSRVRELMGEEEQVERERYQQREARRPGPCRSQ